MSRKVATWGRITKTLVPAGQPPIRWTAAHHTLKHRLERLLFSTAELQWLLAHSDTWPTELRRMVQAMLRDRGVDA